MLASQLSVFSFIIPSFLLCLGGVILWLGQRKYIVAYVRYFACVIIMAGLLQIAQAIAIPHQMIHVLPWLCTWFLLMIALMTHSIYLRFQINIRWSFIGIVIVLSTPIFLYFNYIHYSLQYRLIAISIATTLIFANNIKELVHAQSRNWLDHWLKMVMIVLLVVLSIQIIFLVLMSSTALLSNYLPLFWSSTQFTILFFSMAIFSLLAGCAVHDSMRALKYERNIDPLTGLLNHRALHDPNKLFRELPPAPYALLLCDLDHFKKINDQYGHAVGDLTLQHVSHIMRMTLRHSDRIIRLGGEEFLVILAAPNEAALHTAERLRSMIYHQPLSVAELHIQTSISIGVCCFEHTDDFDTALHDADLLLYQAKKLGRNQVAWQLTSS